MRFSPSAHGLNLVPGIPDAIGYPRDQIKTKLYTIGPQETPLRRLQTRQEW